MDLIDNCTRSRGNLNRNSYYSWSHSNPTDSNQWMERKRRKWSVEGDGSDMVVVYLCLYWSRLFLCLWYCSWCVSLILTFQVIMLSSCFGNSIATHRLSKCKSPHHDYRGIRFLRWKDNWFWSHHLQWNISCTLWVSWIHRMGWITACIIGTMDCKEWQE